MQSNVSGVWGHLLVDWRFVFYNVVDGGNNYHLPSCSKSTFSIKTPLDLFIEYLRFLIVITNALCIYDYFGLQAFKQSLICYLHFREFGCGCENFSNVKWFWWCFSELTCILIGVCRSSLSGNDAMDMTSDKLPATSFAARSSTTRLTAHISFARFTIAEQLVKPPTRLQLSLSTPDNITAHFHVNGV